MHFLAFGGASSGSLSAAGGEAYSFVACLHHSTIDHASLSRRGAVPTSNRETSNIWALITFFPYVTKTFCLRYPLPVSHFVATMYPGEEAIGLDMLGRLASLLATRFA